MNFFERQRQVKRISARLVLLFIVAVIGIVAAVDLAVAIAFNAFHGTAANLIGLLIFTSLVTAVAIGLASLFRMASLRGGGGRVARELGGEFVPQDTTDPQLRRLRNVVEEMAIAAGVPVPEVYVMNHEDGINAFAAGWTPADAAVAVTRGALDRLNRDELQGVIAHEYSHVVNGDMRLNIRLIGLLFGILFLAVIGRTFLQASFFGGGRRSSDEKSGPNPLPIIGIALLAAGGIGVLIGRLIQASVSRQREYLADTSAVQFTRQTSGIAGALKKIAGLAEGSKITSPKRDEVGHMLFGPGAKLSSLFATHPPLLDRIRVLEPSFDAAQLDGLSRQWAAAPPSGLAEDVALGFAPGGAPAIPAADAELPVSAGTVVSKVAELSDTAHQHASAIIGQIPDDVLARARDVEAVVPLVFGLLMAEQRDARAQQHAVLAQHLGTALAGAAQVEADRLAGLHPLLRLPLAQLAFPALRQRTPADRQVLLTAIFALIHADGRITVFEYCLSRLLHSELWESMYPKPKRQPGGSLTSRRTEVAILLAALAQAGHTDPDAINRAFSAGMQRVLPRDGGQRVVLNQGVVELEKVWRPLDALPPQEKEQLVAGAVATISRDGVMTVSEIELLRTICALLHCPLPPLTAPVPA